MNCVSIRNSVTFTRDFVNILTTHSECEKLNNEFALNNMQRVFFYDTLLLNVIITVSETHLYELYFIANKRILQSFVVRHLEVLHKIFYTFNQTMN